MNIFGKKKPKKEGEMDGLLRALETGSVSRAITDQEAAGQKSFVQSTTLPTQMSLQDRKTLEAAGVKFLGKVEDDDLFQYVELPTGWKLEPTNHSMWSNLVDKRGRGRASIFYKAAFYDRRAELHCVPRFGVDIDYEKLDKGIAEAFVTDCGREIFRSVSVSFDAQGDHQLNLDARNQAWSEAYSWLVKRYPNWKNSAEYWD